MGKSTSLPELRHLSHNSKSGSISLAQVDDYSGGRGFHENRGKWGGVYSAFGIGKVR
jgi:hypothetical protein